MPGAPIQEKGGELAMRWSEGPAPRAKPTKALVAGMERRRGARRRGSGEARDQSGPPSAERSKAGRGERSISMPSSTRIEAVLGPKP
jgi:hypothetical protein